MKNVVIFGNLEFIIVIILAIVYVNLVIRGYNVFRFYGYFLGCLILVIDDMIKR